MEEVCLPFSVSLSAAKQDEMRILLPVQSRRVLTCRGYAGSAAAFSVILPTQGCSCRSVSDFGTHSNSHKFVGICMLLL